MMTRFSIRECIAIGKSSHKTAKWSYLDHPVSTNPRKDNLLGGPSLYYVSTFLDFFRPIHPLYQLWQYGLWSFQTGSTKLVRFLPKNQHTQRKLLNFESWISGGLRSFQKSEFKKSIISNFVPPPFENSTTRIAIRYTH